MGDSLPPINLGTGRTAIAIAAGGWAGAVGHTCAALDNGAAKCWGSNGQGQLGLGDTTNRGDQPGEMGDALAAIDLGPSFSVVAISAGALASCALASSGAVKCWGSNSQGQLGSGSASTVGDGPGEMGGALLPVDLGAGRSARSIETRTHTCAWLDDASLKCWGSNTSGELGQGDTAARGLAAGQLGNALPAIDLGNGLLASSVAVGTYFGCATLANGRIKCWGANDKGQLGLGDIAARGDGAAELGDALLPIPVP